MLGWAADVGMAGIAKAGQADASLDAIFQGVDYLVKGHVAPNKMIAQVGAWWREGQGAGGREGQGAGHHAP